MRNAVPVQGLTPLEGLLSVGSIRLGIGIAQGVALSLLYGAAKTAAWPASNGMAFAALLLIACFVPIIVIAGLGNMRPRTLATWAIAASVLYALWAPGASVLRAEVAVRAIAAVEESTDPLLEFTTHVAAYTVAIELADPAAAARSLARLRATPVIEQGHLLHA